MVATARNDRYRTLRVSEAPDEFAPNILYVVGDNHLFYAAMLCPCGCGAVLYMSLLEDDNPRWRIRMYNDGTATMVPSIWREVGCRSHFILFRGRPRWVKSISWPPARFSMRPLDQ